MSHTRILEVPRTRWNGSRQVALACALLLAFAAAPLHAQFTYQDLYDFNCNTGGCFPVDFGSLTQLSDGNFYGTAESSASGLGTLFYVSSSAPVTYGDDFDFSSPYGTSPLGAVTLDAYGTLYTVTDVGGAYGNGTVFDVFYGIPFDLHDFTNSEGSGVASPVAGKDGNLYGVTSGGSAYTITITPTSVAYNSLGTKAAGLSYGPLLLGSDGNLYGTTYSGGTHNLGTIFRMTTPGGAIKTIFNFSTKKGTHPYGQLIQDSAGNLYGTTMQGGTNNTGVVFKRSPTGTYTVLLNFDSGSCNTSGAYPAAGLAAGADGNFYGVTFFGGANCDGTIFQISKTGSFTKLLDFTGNSGAVSGANPYAALTLNTNGKFYGLTYGGGALDEGVYFSLTPLNLIEILIVAGPIFVEPGLPVEILGNNLTQTYEVTFGAVQAQYQIGSDTYLNATVPMDAVDAPISVTLNSGLQIETLGAVHILPAITNLDPPSGPVGTQVGIVGGGFAGATKVTFGGVKATKFTVVTPSLIQATVPKRAKTGKVTVTTPNGTATSTQIFTVN